MTPKERITQEQLETWNRARDATLAALSQVDEETLQKLTRLTLPEIREIQREIAQVLPAGNLPAFILNGLMQLKGRKISAERVRQDITALLRSLELLPQGLFSVVIGGPAALLYAYQKLLQLAGKDAESAFPQGMWQFYLEFGLREDTARHTHETVGFQRALPAPRDRVREAAAWVSAALQLLYTYDDLLRSDWRERVLLRLVQEEAAKAGIDEQAPFATLWRDWNAACPYHAPGDKEDYLRYRCETFERFIRQRIAMLDEAAQTCIQGRFDARYRDEVPSYIEQMTILAALTPETYKEHKTYYPLARAFIGFIWQGQTYLLPACQRNSAGSPLCYPPSGDPIPLYAGRNGDLCDAAGVALDSDRGGRVWYRESKQELGTLRPPAPETILAWLNSIFNAPPAAESDLDLVLVETPRALQATLRHKLPTATQKALDRLSRAPILINWDTSSAEQPLAHIRRGRRGSGDHALTIFRTPDSTVFDQSHIFFDGMWGMAVAEIMTGSAVHAYRRLMAISVPHEMLDITPLVLSTTAEFIALAGKNTLPHEASAESTAIDMRGLTQLRTWLGQRGLRLTVNDLLLLYRAFHATQYSLSPSVRQKLADLEQRLDAKKYRAIWESITQTLEHDRETNPALLIPMDASHVDPKARLFPTTFRNPLPAIVALFDEVQEQYKRYRLEQNSTHWTAFDESRRAFLAHLKAVGEFLNTLKGITMRGESFNTATLRLLGHLPASIQHILDQIPQRIGVLNEVIKGSEVFSNLGRVAPHTSPRRFLSAKDDGATKELVWGIVSDDEGIMHISLRDFRPFVPLLHAAGAASLADALAQDYLDSYVAGFNHFVANLSTLIKAGQR
ncbi:MAG TPA: hypothetical protein PLJ78_17460 [Anaerolineae bacterium]|nr:hypothetical protein [Anaerolineae bacterium]HQK15719.1 hypothetical protein [Anaerolineae bacterium]